jgi:hypothetical protein
MSSPPVAQPITIRFRTGYREMYQALRAVNSAVQLRTGPSVKGQQSVGVADWGLAVSGAMHTGELEWPSLMRVSETNEFFLFFVSKLQAVFLPKRLLSEQQLVEVRRLIHTGLGEEAAVRAA